MCGTRLGTEGANLTDELDVPEPEAAANAATTSWAEFLSERAPPSRAIVEDAALYRQGYWNLAPTAIPLDCDSDACGGTRWFGPAEKDLSVPVTGTSRHFIDYHCRNCRVKWKTYSVLVRMDFEGSEERKTVPQGTKAPCEVTKVGEWPPFGPPIPARVISLIGPDRTTFLQGRRCENQGLGIGAFS